MDITEAWERLEQLFTRHKENVMTQLDDLTAAVTANTQAVNQAVAELSISAPDLQPDIDALNASTAALEAATAPAPAQPVPVTDEPAA